MMNMSNHLGLIERKIRLEKGLTLDNVPELFSEL